MRGGFFFFFFFSLKSPISSFILFRFEFSISIKCFLPLDLSLHSIFPMFLMFLSLTSYDVWFFIRFCMSDSDDNTTSIRQRSHIKSLFISMLHKSKISGILGILGLPIM